MSADRHQKGRTRYASLVMPAQPEEVRNGERLARIGSLARTCLLASLISIQIAISVALIKIMVGVFAGNTIGLHLTEWVNFLVVSRSAV